MTRFASRHGAEMSCPSVLLRVPRPLASSLTYAKRSGSSLLSVFGLGTTSQRAVVATGMVCLPQRNQGGGQGPEGIRGGRYAVAVADSESTCSLIKKLKSFDNDTKKRQFHDFFNGSYLNIKRLK